MRIGIDRTLRVLQIVFLAVGMVVVLTAAGLQLRGSAMTTFVLDYDNTGAETDMSLEFEGGSTRSTNASLSWDATNIRHEFNFPLQAIPLIVMQGTGQLTDGSAGGKTVSFMDDSPSAEWTDSEGNGFVVTSDDATLFKMGSNSLKAAFNASATLEDGVQYTSGQPFNFTDDENWGMWIYSSVALDATDLALELQDDGGEQVLTMGAIAANTWTWEKVTLPAANADKDVISEIRIVQKADKGAFNLFLDAAFKWDSTENTALSQNILEDGDFSAIADITAGGAWSSLVRYTDYFIDYNTGANNLVAVSDQSANKVILGYAYE